MLFENGRVAILFIGKLIGERLQHDDMFVLTKMFVPKRGEKTV
jgi:hypothetical protein